MSRSAKPPTASCGRPSGRRPAFHFSRVRTAAGGAADPETCLRPPRRSSSETLSALLVAKRGIHWVVGESRCTRLPRPGSPQRSPKLRSFQSTEANSEHLTELKTPANNSGDLKSTRCKAVYTGSIPVVALLLLANSQFSRRQSSG